MTGAAPHVVYVLGMHRSGTSAVARMVNLLGASLGADLMPPQEGDNPLGYWEHRQVYELHEALLSALERSWDDPRSLPADAWDRPGVRTVQAELTQLIESELAAHPFFALKDPRMCILEPLWTGVRQQLGYDVSAVAVVRHPRGVIDSLARRSGVPAMLSLWGWWRHNLGWLQISRSVPRVVLIFEEVMADPADAVARVRSLGAPWPSVATEAAERSIDATLPRPLSSECPDGIEPDWWADSLRLYEGLRQGPRAGPEVLEPDLELALKDRMRSVDPALDQLGFLVRSENQHRWAQAKIADHIQALEGQREALRKQLATSEAQRKACEQELRSIRDSGGYRALRRLQLLRRRLLGRS